MFPLASLAGGLAGGGGGGASGKGPSSSASGSQDGNTLRSGGSFSVGGGAPGWLWPVVLGVVAVVGLLVWKPWKD